MKFFVTTILSAILFPLCAVMAQGNDFVERDSVFSDIAVPDSLNLEKIPKKTDTIHTVNTSKNSSLPAKQTNKKTIENNNKAVEFKPIPSKAVIYSAIFPGLGQIYNRKYWKLPIVYGGALGCIYAITWNGSQYNDYKKAYHDITSKDPNDDYWINYLPYGITPESVINDASRMSTYTGTFKNRRDMYRRNRDLAYIVSVGVYAICMLDAYVDAQLFDFDISPNLSMRVEPVIYNKSVFNSYSMGLQCSIKF